MNLSDIPRSMDVEQLLRFAIIMILTLDPVRLYQLDENSFLVFSVIAVVQLINKKGRLTDCGRRDTCEGMQFTPQDVAVIGAFLSLLGPHIFASSMLQPKRKMHIKVRSRLFLSLCKRNTVVHGHVVGMPGPFLSSDRSAWVTRKVVELHNTTH